MDKGIKLWTFTKVQLVNALEAHKKAHPEAPRVNELLVSMFHQFLEERHELLGGGYLTKGIITDLKEGE